MNKQCTIGEKVKFEGAGLHTGRKVEVTCHPSEENTGIRFKRTDVDSKPVMKLPEDICFEGPGRNTTLIKNGTLIMTIEHLLAALWALKIDNIMVEITGEELPALDGSARCFYDLLSEGGKMLQTDERRVIELTEPEKVSEGKSSLEVFPAEEFSLTYQIDYPVKCIGQQEFTFDPRNSSFAEEIAPARTFCMRQEAEMLLKHGFGQGADPENTLILEDDGPVKTRMRFENEPVRHKVLDLLGDMYMLGRPLKCRVKAVRSGHSLNALMVRKIYSKYVN